MKAIRLVSIAALCSGLVLAQGVNVATTASVAPSESFAAATEPDPSLLKELRGEARGSVSVTRESGTGRAGFISAGLNGDLLPGNDARAVDKAAAFMNTYAPLLGATGSSQLRQIDSSTDDYGTTVTYEQVFQGVPVFGGILKAHLDADGDLTAVNGAAVPNLALATTPRLTAPEIGKRAVATVRSDPPTSEDGEAGSTAGIRAVSAKLFVYRTGLIRGETGTNELAYRIEVTNRKNVRDIVFLHADTGKVLNRYSMIENAHDGLERKLYEVSPDSKPVWKEGDAFPGALNQEQKNLVRASGESYSFFKNAFGRNSYDDAGAHMRTVNNDPSISCPNANWNGRTTNYCNGVTSDDVVAHEWGHAYTEYTHGLIYQYQSGALNESYSDIWGETIDLINKRQDGDETNQKRGDGKCSTNTGSLPILVINSPADIAKICPAGGASFGPELDDTGVTGLVVQGLDVAEPASPGPPPLVAGTTMDGCSPFTNAAAVAGKIALVDRGRCAFIEKTQNAQAAGAIAVIIGNNVPGEPFNMSGTNPAITIPTVMISQANANLIRTKANNTVNVTMKDSAGERDDSFRWLIGEDSSAFGGAIRDMWTPTCQGDPGKVSDAQYHCTPDDAGGVHSNSGVPNHGYALLVDGGSYNGVTVPGIGLTRAAHIYWRAQSEYQTEMSDFTDHANSLDMACADLIGKELNALSTAGAPEAVPSMPVPADGPVNAETCTAVNAMIQAVELRKDPAQCNFQPLLAKNPPSLCTNNQKRHTVWEETFSDGLAGWDVSEKWTFGEQPFHWKTDSSLPRNRPGKAAFAVDPEGGSCQGDANDYSGVMKMRSKPILIPGRKQKSPRLSFRHYVATEAIYDGGNVKVSVNDGPFDVVPTEAYIFNAPNVELEATNPLAPQEGFSGTDGGELTGSWGESQIDLTMIGAQSGDSIEVRFAMGLDGCGGRDGWYVDDITVSTCKAPTKTTAEHINRPTRQGTAPRVKVTVKSPGGQGIPTGKVLVRVPEGKILGSGTLTGGDTSVFLPTTMKVGVRDLVARYRGSDLHKPSTDAFTVRIVK